MTAFSLLLALAFQATGVGPESVDWSVTWQNQVPSTGVRAPLVALGPPREMTASISARNSGTTAVTLTRVAETFEFRLVRADVVVNLNVRCLQARARVADSFVTLHVLGDVTLAPNDSMTLLCLIGPGGQPFDGGDYKIEGTFNWGREKSVRLWSVLFREPHNAAEWTRFHLHEGSIRTLEGIDNWAEGIRHLELAAAASPMAHRPLFLLAAAYEHEKRYSEAFRAWESALALPGAVEMMRGTQVPEFIARTYSSTGDRQSAARVLRLFGRPQSQIDAVLGSGPGRK